MASTAGRLQCGLATALGKHRSLCLRLPTGCPTVPRCSLWQLACPLLTAGRVALCRGCRNEAIAWAKLQRIFISSLAADNILGLPGMLCTISAARERGYEAADEPLHIYGPPGLADFIKCVPFVGLGCGSGAFHAGCVLGLLWRAARSCCVEQAFRCTSMGCHAGVTCCLAPLALDDLANPPSPTGCAAPC